MCTLTFASFSGRLRVVFNRDELRTRAAALPPVVVQTGEYAALMPIDPVSRGTWMGVNSAGLVVCLLNSTTRSPRASAAEGKRSRGLIVPKLLDAKNAVESAALIQEMDASEFPPFKVFMIERYRWCMAQSDGETIYIHDVRANIQPLMFASSGLGDEVVDGPRRNMFDELLASGRFTPDAQDAFHRHAWDDRKEVSVRMSRADAHTVSRTTIELAASAIMTYEDLVQTENKVEKVLDLNSSGAITR